MNVLHGYTAKLFVDIHNYVDLELEDHSDEIHYPPLYSVLNANSRGDKIFQRGPNSYIRNFF